MNCLVNTRLLITCGTVFYAINTNDVDLSIKRQNKITEHRIKKHLCRKACQCTCSNSFLAENVLKHILNVLEITLASLHNTISCVSPGIGT